MTDQTARDLIAESIRRGYSPADEDDAAAWEDDLEALATRIHKDLTDQFSVVRLTEPVEVEDDGYASWDSCGDLYVESHPDGDGIELGGFTHGTTRLARQVAADLLSAADRQEKNR